MDLLKGDLRLEITDAPIDDRRIEATFITISEIRLDGDPIEGYQTSTFDVYALQNGLLDVLVEAEVESGSYQVLELDLNYDTDAEGNSPGCYVLDSDGTTHMLGMGEETLI